MRLLTSWIVAFVLAVPCLALGQAIKRADLVGTWVYRRDGAEWSDSLKGQLVVTYLKVDRNGTYAYEGKIKQNDGKWRAWGVGWAKGSWSLAGDTLRFKDARSSSASYKVVLKNGKLLWWNWNMWDAGRHDEKCTEKVFERFDASKPLSLPPLPQITLQPADIVGTWAGTFETKHFGTITDTLIIGANHSLTSVRYGWNPYHPERDHLWARGGWTLLPGDELTGAGLVGRYRVALHNGELVPCSPLQAVLKRVGP